MFCDFEYGSLKGGYFKIQDVNRVLKKISSPLRSSAQFWRGTHQTIQNFETTNYVSLEAIIVHPYIDDVTICIQDSLADSALNLPF